MAVKFKFKLKIHTQQHTLHNHYAHNVLSQFEFPTIKENYKILIWGGGKKLRFGR